MFKNNLYNLNSTNIFKDINNNNNNNNSLSILNIIRDQGFFIFKNILNDHEINIAKKYFYDNKVNYNRLKNEFINPFMINKVENLINKKLVNIKYRASNNNNSSDAGCFHRDLHVITPDKNIKVYTILIYLDGGNMQIIPESNKNQFMNFIDIIKYWKKIKNIQLSPRDILIFEMTTLHRGIFYNKQPNRRLIQLFDTVYEEDLDFFLKTVMHISCKDKCNKFISNFFINTSKNKFINKIINTVGYYNSAFGYGRGIIKKFISNKEIKYLSTESNQPRAIIINNIFQKDNLYVLNFKSIDIPKQEWNCYIFFAFFFNIIILILLISVVIFITFYILKNKLN